MKQRGYIILTFKFTKEKENWVGICTELGTSAFAKDIEDAIEKLKELTLLHLNTLEEVGESQRVFKENNIKFYTQKPSKEHKVNCDLDPNTYVNHLIQPIQLSA